MLSGCMRMPGNQNNYFSVLNKRMAAGRSFLNLQQIFPLIILLMPIKVAIIYQIQTPPARNGIVKPMKPGGYADSGADIGFPLRVLSALQNCMF